MVHFERGTTKKRVRDTKFLKVERVKKGSNNNFLGKLKGETYLKRPFGWFAWNLLQNSLFLWKFLINIFQNQKRFPANSYTFLQFLFKKSDTTGYPLI